MGSLVLLVSFSLLSLLCETKVTPVFVQTGEDLLLEVKEAVFLGENDQIIWSVNDSISIAKHEDGSTKYFRNFSGRAKLFPPNLSLLLENLTKSDSGEYKARIFGDRHGVVADHKVQVLDPVSPVNLTVTNCSSDFSNLTVICSTQDSLISRTFTCDDQSCSEETGEGTEFTTPAASLKVYLKKDSIICVHSNQVSRKRDVRKIEDFCEKEKEPDGDQPTKKVQWIVLSVFGVALLLLIIIVGVILCRRRRSEYKTQSVECTEYEVPQVNRNLPPEQRPMNDSLSNETPSTIYHLLGHPIESETSTGAEVKTLPESVYATVQKTPKT